MRLKKRTGGKSRKEREDYENNNNNNKRNDGVHRSMQKELE
jgi:hypothetical protein